MRSGPFAPSTGFPSAPPSLATMGSPYTRIPLPAVDVPGLPPSIEFIAVHHLLAPNSAMRCDLRLSPEHITILSNNIAYPINPRTASEAATSPKVPMLPIKSKYLPWPIIVHANYAYNFVTVGDVVNALYSELQRWVTGQELANHHALREQQKIEDCARQRSRLHIASSMPTRRSNEDGAVRRIDWLFGATVFRGLTRRENYFELHVSYS